MDESANRSRRIEKKTPTYKTKTLKEIKEKIKAKQEISGLEIEKFLSCIPNFIGCYSDDHLNYISIQSFPALFILNFDKSSQVGSHWVAVRLDRTSVEIFDPLGFNVSYWPTIPTCLIDFLRRLSFHRKIIISHQLQTSKSVLCGFFCIFYVLLRNKFTLSKIQQKFSKRLHRNDSILLYNFHKLIK